MIVFFCFMHDRVREEEMLDTAPSVTAAQPVSVRANA
jgi:hypothetical protein